jgi:hypothetical protein
MSDVLLQFRKLLPSLKTKSDLTDAMKVVDEQISVEAENVKDMMKKLFGKTEPYRQLWLDSIERRRMHISELENVKRLLTLKLKQMSFASGDATQMRQGAKLLN